MHPSLGYTSRPAADDATGDPATLTERLAGLEVCRFLCGLAVLVWHYQHFFVRGPWDGQITAPDRMSFPLYVVLMPFYQYGWMAVQVFWAISGYIFFLKYGRSLKSGQVGASEFFVLRFSRLYPLHLVTLLLVAWLQILFFERHGTTFVYAHNDAVHFVEQLAMASNWLSTQPYTFNGPIWSVSTEVIVYAVFFLAVRTAVPNAVTCVALALVAFAGYCLSPTALSLCVALFFLGGLTSIVLRSVSADRCRVACLVSSIAVVWGVLLIDGKPIPSPAPMILLPMAILVLFATIEHALALDLRKAAWLGNLTYSSYLLHFPLQIVFLLLGEQVGLAGSIFRSPLALLTWLLTTFALAALSYRYLEMPAQTAIRSVSKGRAWQLAPRPP